MGPLKCGRIMRAWIDFSKEETEESAGAEQGVMGRILTLVR